MWQVWTAWHRPRTPRTCYTRPYYTSHLNLFTAWLQLTYSLNVLQLVIAFHRKISASGINGASIVCLGMFCGIFPKNIQQSYVYLDIACRPQALILSPTRELAVQTTKNIQIIGENLKVVPHACIGGKSIGTISHRPPSLTAA